MRCSLALPIGLGVLLTACSATPTGVVTQQNARQTMLSAAAATNGRGGVMPAYYDAQLFTINFKEEPGGAEQALLAHNGSINTDRKSTRLNSSHLVISYAVFCLKKKKKNRFTYGPPSANIRHAQPAA